MNNYIIIMLVSIVSIVLMIETEVRADGFYVLLKGAEWGDEQIRSAEGEILYESVRTDSTSKWSKEFSEKIEAGNAKRGPGIVVYNRKADVNFAFDEVKFRCEEGRLKPAPYGSTLHEKTIHAFNGEKVDILKETTFITQEGRPKSTTGSISDFQQQDLFEVGYDPRFYGLGVYGTRVGAFLKGESFYHGKYILENLDYIGEKQRGDIQCSVITGNIIGSTQKLTVWLAKEYMYRPVYIEKGNNKYKSIICNDFKKYENEIFFPNMTDISYYVYDVDNGQWIKTRHETYEYNNFVINNELTTEKFELVFPDFIQPLDLRTD